MISDDGKIYVVNGPRGFTESIPRVHVETLERMGVVVFDREDYVMSQFTQDGETGIGPLHRFYVMAPS